VRPPDEDQPTAIMLGMTRREAYEFLRALAEDDDFRRRLEEDPAAVLGQQRFWVAGPEELSESVTLPPKELVGSLVAELSGPDEAGNFEGTAELYGYGIFAIAFRVAFAMPLIAPERAATGHGAD
jgi:hypothetical protein